ncbi:hypothetical protein vseg_016633 [Gypsophila vaccaria]
MASSNLMTYNVFSTNLVNKKTTNISLITTTTTTTTTRRSSTLSPSSCCISAQLRTRPIYIPNRIPDSSYVRILDTTLRDGEQAPGAAMTGQQKLDVANMLASLGVDVIEAGFPCSSKEEFEAVRRIAEEVGNNVVDETGFVPVIGGFARCVKKDVQAAWDAVKAAKYPRVTIFIGTSGIHMKHKLRKSEEDIINSVREVLGFAKSLGVHDLQFIAEDASRSEKRFVYQLFEEAIKAGATTLDMADTVGYRLPHEWGNYIEDVKKNVSGIENVVLATHCHNDLGLATANTISAARAGARQLEVTINGIGERAGNASLEEVVMAIKCRGQDLIGGLYTGINTPLIYQTSKMVEEYSGLRLQPHKAIVGANAFSHASGIHQDGVLKHRGTYEIMAAEDVGRSTSGGIVLGKLSGRHAFQHRLQQLGYEVDARTFDEMFIRFKTLAENKKSLSDSDMKSLLQEEKLVPTM